MNYFLQRATELYNETVANRRYIHQNAELGMELPKTVARIKEELAKYGYDNVCDCGGGVTCTVGSGEKCILLRADMDALPQTEITGLPYSCTTGACHSCGHDFHAAMLLTAARMLKEKEAELDGVVKFMFQPGEELLMGAKSMLDAGILSDPKVDVAFGMHTGSMPSGKARIFGNARSGIGFKILVHGQTCHGASPHKGKSALVTAAQIVLATSQIPAWEINSEESAVISFGQFASGEAGNIIPGEALLQGSIRVYDNELGSFCIKRMEEITKAISEANGTKAEFVITCMAPALVNNTELGNEMHTYIAEVIGEENLTHDNKHSVGTEDFAFVSMEVPTLFFDIGVNAPGDYGGLGHDPARVRQEDGLKYGAACYANSAYQWLKNNKI